MLAWRDGAPWPCAALQARIARKAVTRRMLAEAPAHLLACDLLEHDGHDLRGQTFDTRRVLLDDLVARLPPGLPLSVFPLIPFADWPALAATRARSRAHHAEGIMLSLGLSAYVAGPGRGDCWMWKADPLRVVAVMVYAQAGRGPKTDLCTDFTFAVRDGEALVPFAKARSGLTDAEFVEIATWVKTHTLERFGPVRRVAPDLVFELAFDAIQPSPRHRSGVTLGVTRIARWHRDKPVSGIDTLDTLRALLP